MLIVEVEEGKLRGVEKKSTLTGDAYYAFLGIPYAQPPIGELRFQAPVPGEKWNGILDASEEGKQCTQTEYSGGIKGSEDCLYLNVCTPQPPSDIKDKKAVMVYIHGGGFQKESGSMNRYGPDYLIGHDVIFVTLNYRLHVLGFLNTGTSNCPGNAGLKDQHLALKWVQRNIASFGGDPQNVTLIGESAGGASVHLQMLSPLSKDLFHRAIIQSGNCFVPWALTTKSEWLARRIGELADYKGQDLEGLVEHLKKLEDVTLCKLADQCYEDIQKVSPAGIAADMFCPSVENIKDGAFLPDFPENLMKDAPPIPIIIGYNNQEGVLFPMSHPDILCKIIEDPSMVVKDNFNLGEEKQEELLTRIKKFYFNDIEPWTPEGVIKLYTDLYFIKFFDAIDYQVKSNFPPYVYLFSYDGTFNSLIIMAREGLRLNITGAAHADELGYIFSSEERDIAKATDVDIEVMKNLCTIWTDFIKHGNPVHSLVPIECWKPHTDSHHCYLSMEKKLTVFTEKLYEERHDFWREWSSSFIR